MPLTGYNDAPRTHEKMNCVVSAGHGSRIARCEIPARITPSIRSASRARVRSNAGSSGFTTPLRIIWKTPGCANEKSTNADTTTSIWAHARPSSDGNSASTRDMTPSNPRRTTAKYTSSLLDQWRYTVPFPTRARAAISSSKTS